MEKYLKQIATTTGATVYMFICGALYTFFYWSLFDFDITNLITITDIPKSIFTAVFLSISVLGLASVIGFITEVIKIKNRYVHFCLRFILFAAFFLLVFDYNHFFLAFVVVLILTICISLYFFESIFNYVNSNKSIIFYILLFIPLLCSVLGVLKSGSIRNNSERTNYVSTIQCSDTTLANMCLHKKLIGYIGDKIILSDKLNSDFVVVNQSSISSISYSTDTLSFAVKSK